MGPPLKICITTVFDTLTFSKNAFNRRDKDTRPSTNSTRWGVTSEKFLKSDRAESVALHDVIAAGGRLAMRGPQCPLHFRLDAEWGFIPRLRPSER